MHIVLIEPDRIQAKIISEALRRNGHTVTHAVSAQSAVQAVDERSPELIILELQLSRHNGVEFLYEFRSYPEWQSTPVIVYSYVPERELDHAATLYRELGVVRVLYKPKTSLAMLCDVVGQVGSVTAS